MIRQEAYTTTASKILALHTRKPKPEQAVTRAGDRGRA